MKRLIKLNNKGVALVTVLMVFLVTAVTSMAVISYATQSMRRSFEDEEHSEAYYYAYAAAETVADNIYSLIDGAPGNPYVKAMGSGAADAAFEALPPYFTAPEGTLNHEVVLKFTDTDLATDVDVHVQVQVEHKISGDAHDIIVTARPDYKVVSPYTADDSDKRIYFDDALSSYAKRGMRFVISQTTTPPSPPPAEGAIIAQAGGTLGFLNGISSMDISDITPAGSGNWPSPVIYKGNNNSVDILPPLYLGATNTLIAGTDLQAQLPRGFSGPSFNGRVKHPYSDESYDWWVVKYRQFTGATGTAGTDYYAAVLKGEAKVVAEPAAFITPGAPLGESNSRFITSVFETAGGLKVRSGISLNDLIIKQLLASEPFKSSKDNWDAAPEDAKPALARLLAKDITEELFRVNADSSLKYFNANWKSNVLYGSRALPDDTIVAHLYFFIRSHPEFIESFLASAVPEFVVTRDRDPEWRRKPGATDTDWLFNYQGPGIKTDTNVSVHALNAAWNVPWDPNRLTRYSDESRTAVYNVIKQAFLKKLYPSEPWDISDLDLLHLAPASMGSAGFDISDIKNFGGTGDAINHEDFRDVVKIIRRIVVTQNDTDKLFPVSLFPGGRPASLTDDDCIEAFFREYDTLFISFEPILIDVENIKNSPDAYNPPNATQAGYAARTKKFAYFPVDWGVYTANTPADGFFADETDAVRELTDSDAHGANNNAREHLREDWAYSGNSSSARTFYINSTIKVPAGRQFTIVLYNMTGGNNNDAGPADVMNGGLKLGPNARFITESKPPFSVTSPLITGPLTFAPTPNSGPTGNNTAVNILIKQPNIPQSGSGYGMNIEIMPGFVSYPDCPVYIYSPRGFIRARNGESRIFYGSIYAKYFDWCGKPFLICYVPRDRAIPHLLNGDGTGSTPPTPPGTGGSSGGITYHLDKSEPPLLTAVSKTDKISW